ncbi:MAG: nicotinate-nucleotide adenylyltransferase [Vicinamibacterales bacterium]
MLGGTFDPIHVGHLDVARAAAAALALDDVQVMPSRIPPHRRPPRAPAEARLAMVRLAIAGEARFKASDLEVRSEGPSYTTATLDRLQASGVDLGSVFVITGADAFRDIATWKDYPAILDRCHFVAVSRPGCPAPGLRDALPALAARMVDAAGPVPAPPAIILVDAPTAPVSSTEVRQRLAAGESVAGLVPPAVAAYIESHGLYRSPDVKEQNGQG